jgi:DNA processing protein
MSWGPNLLIKQGAKLVQEWNDVVVELKPEDRRRLVELCRNRLKLNGNELGEPNDSVQSSVGLLPVGGANRAVLAALKPDAPVPLDSLVESLEGHSPSEIIAALFELEMGGMVRQLPGKSFIRVWLD